MSLTRRRKADFLGNSMTALCGGALAFNLLMILALLALIGYQGGRTFWQRDLVRIELADGRILLGELHDRREIPFEFDSRGEATTRTQVKVGNRDFGTSDFVWVSDADVVTSSKPADSVLLERLEWGNFHGWLAELRLGDDTLASGHDSVWKAFLPLWKEKVRERESLRELERGPIGEVNLALEKNRLAQKRVEISDLGETERERRLASLHAEEQQLEARYQTLASELFERRAELTAETVVLEAADGSAREIPVANVVRALRPNRMGAGSRLGLYLSRVWEFVSADPRESNTEGGIFPAIFGTVMMVFLMSIAVVPFGVLAAIYLREYARQGLLVRTVRIAVNNLAGVPSIVFGMFGLGFFVYLVGGSLDRIFYPESLPTPTFGTGGILWAALTLALLTVPVVIVATEEGLAAVPQIVRAGSLALGATKWETTAKVVVPAAAPGILTGVILAMARAAGEVAPLMIVGMVKLAPALPIDHHFPFVHFERKFMHLGFHIYDVGFQSPNVDASKPLVYATALLLILVVTAMNLVAIVIRNRLRRNSTGSSV